MKQTIFVFDSYEDDRRLVKRILEKNNFIVEDAASSDDAVKLVKSKKIDLVLLDPETLQIDCDQFLALTMQERHKQKISLIIYSSKSYNDEELNLYKADGYINKYSDPCELINKINLVLSGK